MRGLFIGAAATLAVCHPVQAQVGHLPESSPYKDMRIKQTISFVGGYLAGGRGSAGVGPSGGTLAGLRWDITVGAPTVLFLSVMRADLERRLVNPDDPPATRFFGSAGQDVYVVDGGFNLMLTGRKTWRGLAPYFGGSLGVAFGGAFPEDSSGFRFGNKFQVGPALGVRIHPSRRLHLRIEGRNILWRLNYPQRFFQDPANAPGEPLLDINVQRPNEWVHHPTLVLAIGYTLRL